MQAPQAPGAWGASSSPEAKGMEKRQGLRKGCSICPVPTKKDARKASFDDSTGAAQAPLFPMSLLSQHSCHGLDFFCPFLSMPAQEIL